jgi:hypothetical protein
MIDVEPPQFSIGAAISRAMAPKAIIFACNAASTQDNYRSVAAFERRRREGRVR